MDGVSIIVFDYAIRGNKYGMEILQLAEACVAIAPDKRPSMDEVVRAMEKINSSKSKLVQSAMAPVKEKT